MSKIARRLGDNDPTPDFPPRKPKWMRLATYERLLEGGTTRPNGATTSTTPRSPASWPVAHG